MVGFGWLEKHFKIPEEVRKIFKAPLSVSTSMINLSTTATEISLNVLAFLFSDNSEHKLTFR